MGWYYTYGASRADIIKELLVDGKTDTGTSKVLAHCTRGNVLWSVREFIGNDGTTLRWIGCDLLTRSKDGWGYKPMDESMGPCYYTVPLSYFDLAPNPEGKWAIEWRDKVRAAYAAKKAKAT
jgi:hypothetical protein